MLGIRLIQIRKTGQSGLVTDWFVFRLAQNFGRTYINGLVCMEPSEVSLLWFLWYMKNTGHFKRSFELDNGAQVCIASY